MTVWFAALALGVIAAVAAELLFPGKSVYHAGWFNAALIALAVIVASSARKPVARAASSRVRVATLAVVFGVAIAGVAGAASGLLGPDSRTVIGAPGQRVRVDDLGGTLDFPMSGVETASRATDAVVILSRGKRRPSAISDRGIDAGSFILRSIPRTVVYVEARDLHGARLTVTQPSGSAFLSPVLLMQQRQTIAGLSVPFDGFAVPAAHRTVKAVLFTPQEAATLRGMDASAGPAVLFAVDDEDDRPLQHAIALARSGGTVSAGGLRLQAAIFTYPAVEIVAAPPIVATVAGALLALAGLIAGLRGRDAAAWRVP